MRTAIDTNIISGLWSKEPTASRMLAILAKSRSIGSLVICGPVYAELHAHPAAAAGFVDEFLASAGIDVELELDASIWPDIARGFASYAHRRRLAGGQQPRRLLADFIIGSHAFHHADRLLTLDPRIYVQDFPQLKLLP
jgi:predicted nucleic acid-binding protein